MRKVFCSTVFALLSFVPGASAAGQTAPFALVVPISMPEPSSPALLAVDLLAVGALVFFLRRRISGTNR